MKTAIITGASAGLGREFLRHLPTLFPDIEEYWLISRSKDKLSEAAREVPRQCRIFPLDLTLDESYEKFAAELERLKPEVWMLINNSGCGFLGNVGEGELKKQTQMVDLNLKGLTAMTHVTLPYMHKGGCVINVSSIASFCPNPRMTVYSASKAYVSAFTGGLADELRPKGITVTAVCPGPMKTEFFDAAGDHDLFGNIPWCDPVRVVAGTIRAAKKGRTFYTPTAFNKFYRFVAKILPMKWMIKATRV